MALTWVGCGHVMALCHKRPQATTASRCGAVRCGAVRCGAVRCGAVRCGAVRCHPFRSLQAVRLPQEALHAEGGHALVCALSPHCPALLAHYQPACIVMPHTHPHCPVLPSKPMSPYSAINEVITCPRQQTVLPSCEGRPPHQLGIGM
jgi:hypothetical protein